MSFAPASHMPFSVVESSLPAANPATLGLVSLSGTTVVEVTLWDMNQHTIDLGNNTGESVSLSISTAISLPQALANASYSLPNNAVGGELKVVSGAGIAINLNGTVDGSAGASAGFTNSGDAPTAASVDQFLPGQTLKFGRFSGSAVGGSSQRTANVFKYFDAQSITASTPVTIWTPASGKKFVLMGFNLSLSVAGHHIFKDNTTEILAGPDVAAGTSAKDSLGAGLQSSAINQALKIDVSATGTVSGFVYGVEE